MKIVALVDSTSSKETGHHKAFMCLFTKTLLELDYKVLVLMPQKNNIDDWIYEHCNQYSDQYYSKEFEFTPHKNRLWGRFNQAVDMLNKWRATKKNLKKAEKEKNIKIDFVFFAFLDNYLANYLHPKLVDIVFPYKWFGLYFHPFYLRFYPDKLNAHPSISEFDSILMSKKCQAISIHDEGIIEKYQKRLKGKRVILFPEMADDTPPIPNLDLVQQIKTNAKGRTIVGLIGFTFYKGLNTFIKVAQKANSEDFYFVFAGKWSKNAGGYTEHQLNEANHFFENPPENAFIYLDFIPEGAYFNALFNSFDIPFLVYDNFSSSSNNLTKAAIFEKKVIASKGFCIGEDIENYQLGLLVSAGNVDECIDTLYKLKNNNHSLLPKFEQYRKLHSLASLKDKFIELLEYKS